MNDAYTEALADALAVVRDEVGAADARWGIAHDPFDLVWFAVLSEETGEIARALNEPWPRPLSYEESQALCQELAQVAAVAVRWMVRLRRRETG